MAKASGVHLVDPSPKTIFEANSFGTGVLIQEAIKKGAKDIFLGIGGSATHDLGTGILRSLGVKFYDDKGNILESPQELFRLDSIDFSSLENLPQDLHITFLCDVNNKLLGENGAAYTYAKQKGAETKALIEKCEELSKVFYKYFQENLGIEIGNRAGDGAAGGLPSIIRVLINAELKSGASFIFDIANIDSLISKVSIVITGEGSFDQQSYYGKGPGLLLERAKLEDIYSIALCGKISPQVYRESNRNISFFSINNSSESLSEAIINTKNNLYVCSKNILSVLKLGLKQKKQLN
jgi:glycerate kinase